MHRFLADNERKIVAALLLLLFLQAAYTAYAKSPTYDESHHSTAAHYYLKTGNYTFDVEHTPLKTVAALPFLYRNLSTPRCFMCVDSYGDQYENALFYSRIIIIAFSLLLGFFVYLWAKKLFGLEAGMLALFFYTFEPNIIAHSALFTSDLLATAFIFISSYYFWAFLSNSKWKNVLVFGLAFGLALISKFSALLLFPIYAAVFLIYAALRRERIAPFIPKFFAALVISLFTINASYLFSGTFTKLGDYNFNVLNTLKNEYTSWVPVPLPRYYLEGMEVARWHSEGGHFGWYAFLMGEYSKMGWWYYFIVAFLIKTPVTTLLMLSLFLAVFFANRLYKNPSYYFLLVPIAAFVIAISFFNHVNIGLRYILPVYPFIFVAIGSLYSFFSKSSFRMNILIFLLVFYLLSSLSIFPHYLAYFNELVGGPENGHKYLIDSNLDWGQDDKLIEEYAKTHAIIKNPGCSPVKGLIAVNANSLRGIFDDYGINCYRWLRENYEPVDYVGYSWLVYNITE